MVGLKSVSIYYFASLAILSGAQTGLYSFYMMLTALQSYALQGDSAVVTLLLENILLSSFYSDHQSSSLLILLIRTSVNVSHFC